MSEQESHSSVRQRKKDEVFVTGSEISRRSHDELEGNDFEYPITYASKEGLRSESHDGSKPRVRP